jgi:hypothetical protein
MNTKVALGGGGAVVVLVVGWLYATPYLAVRGMRSAADARDGAALSSYVDFPAVRDSLKTSVNGRVASMAAPLQGNPLAAFGAAMATAMADPMIDALVTPESLELMLKGNVPQQATGMMAATSSDGQVETTMGYEGFNSFVLTVKGQGLISNPIGFVMSRNGVFSWKLSAVRLP